MQDENYDSGIVIIEKDDEYSVDYKKIQEEKKQHQEESKSQDTSE